MAGPLCRVAPPVIHFPDALASDRLTDWPGYAAGLRVLAPQDAGATPFELVQARRLRTESETVRLLQALRRWAAGNRGCAS